MLALEDEVSQVNRPRKRKVKNKPTRSSPWCLLSLSLPFVLVLISYIYYLLLFLIYYYSSFLISFLISYLILIFYFPTRSPTR